MIDGGLACCSPQGCRVRHGWATKLKHLKKLTALQSCPWLYVAHFIVKSPLIPYQQNPDCSWRTFCLVFYLSQTISFFKPVIITSISFVVFSFSMYISFILKAKPSSSFLYWYVFILSLWKIYLGKIYLGKNAWNIKHLPKY